MALSTSGTLSLYAAFDSKTGEVLGKTMSAAFCSKSGSLVAM
jgi:hypothetical protein